MNELSVFNDSFDIVRDPYDDDAFDVALEISNFKNNRSETLSELPSKVMYIYEREIRRNFVELMLFLDASHTLIAKACGVEEKVITMYSAIFFDNTLIIGEIGKTEYYEEIFATADSGSKEYMRAEMFREAHLGGVDVVLQQFNIELDGHDTRSYKNRVAQFANWKHRQLVRGDIRIEEYVPVAKAATDIINTIDKATKNDESAKQSDLEALAGILQQMHDAGIGTSEVEVKSYDPATEEVIDVPMIESKQQEESEDK